MFRLLMVNVVLGVRYRGASSSSGLILTVSWPSFNISVWSNERTVSSSVSPIPTTMNDCALRCSYSSIRLYKIMGLYNHYSVTSLGAYAVPLPRLSASSLHSSKPNFAGKKQHDNPSVQRYIDPAMRNIPRAIELISSDL